MFQRVPYLFFFVHDDCNWKTIFPHLDLKTKNGYRETCEITAPFWITFRRPISRNNRFPRLIESRGRKLPSLFIYLDAFVSCGRAMTTMVSQESLLSARRELHKKGWYGKQTQEVKQILVLDIENNISRAIYTIIYHECDCSESFLFIKAKNLKIGKTFKLIFCKLLGTYGD